MLRLAMMLLLLLKLLLLLLLLLLVSLGLQQPCMPALSLVVAIAVHRCRCMWHAREKKEQPKSEDEQRTRAFIEKRNSNGRS